MNKTILILGVMALIGVVFVGSVVMWGVGVRDRTIGLENQFAAGLESREMLYDNMVKQVQEKFAVAKFDRKTIIAMVDKMVEGQKGGSLFKSIQALRPDVDSSMMKEVQATIGGKRDEFTRSQQVLAQLKKEHSDLRTQTLSSLIVGSRPPLEFEVVSSSKAKEVMATGKDDETILGDEEIGDG